MGAVTVAPAALALAAALLNPDPEEARELLVRELAKEEYQNARPSVLESVLQRILDWFADLISQLNGFSPNLGTLILVLAALLLIGAAVWVVKPRLNARRRAAAEIFDAAVPLTADEHRRNSRDAAAREDWDTALAERFRGLVRSMEERVVLDPQPGRTADEAAAGIAAAFSAEAGRLRAAANRFDSVRYGKVPASRDDVERLAALDDSLAAASPAAARASIPPLAVPR
ncbi:DUF4129 domain-containing protein [Arthrobacter sp. NPDC089319]|uniref:DUF4129 domain-containing protein n=1 Tax=Arthrobacter sp. NPDC089319 TaxID=3155915 RepID=UPI00342F0058